MSSAPSPGDVTLAELNEIRTLLDSALKLARALDGIRTRNLDQSRDLVQELAYDLARVHKRSFDFDPDFARNLAFDYDLNYARNLAFDLDQEFLSLIQDLQGTFVTDSGRDLLISRLAGRLGRELPRLTEVVESVHGQVIALWSAMSAEIQVHGSAGTQTGPMVTGTAIRIVTLAVRSLPPVDRCRYRDEFSSDLWELAAAGAGRVGQLRHAVRQLICAPSLRRALKAEHASRRVLS